MKIFSHKPNKSLGATSMIFTKIWLSIGHQDASGLKSKYGTYFTCKASLVAKMRPKIVTARGNPKPRLLLIALAVVIQVVGNQLLHKS